MFIAVVENHQVTRTGQLVDLFPNSVFGAAGPGADWLAANNAYIVQMHKNHDAASQRLITVDPYDQEGVVYGVTVADLNESEQQLAIDQKWDSVRAQRSMLINKMQWRVDRYNREVRMGLTPTDNITELDNYFHQLAEITTQSDTTNIIWPNPPL